MTITSREGEFDNVTSGEAAKRLKSVGIKRRWTGYFVMGRGHCVAISLGVVLVAGLFFLATSPNTGSQFPKELGTPLAALIAALIGLEEWRSAKTEAALDRFYDRLNVTNERLRIWRNPRSFISREWLVEDTFEMEMYVCMELDNLEYMIQKYERGYMEPKDAYRALTCFTSRCQDGNFKKTALAVGTRGRYKTDTMKALAGICEVCLRVNQYRCGSTPVAPEPGRAGKHPGA